MITLGLSILLGLNFQFLMNNRNESEVLFDRFQTDFNKSYLTKHEQNVRKGIFIKNLETISRHNSEKTNTFKMGINQFTDMTYKELYDLNYSSDEVYGTMNTRRFVEPEIEEVENEDLLSENVPESFDWREHGIISRVKNQRLCGSCFAFAVLEGLESQFVLQKNKSYEFSRQEIMECAKDGYGSLGCSGGILYGVIAYIQARGGLAEEKNYPYKAKESVCRNEKIPKIHFTVEGIRNFEIDDEEILKRALYKYGPIVIIIDNLHDSFFRYSHGVYYEPACNTSEDYSHAALIVGYGSENGNDYWIIKNSYGENWGEKGYMRLARNRNNHCKVASFNMIAII